MAKYAPWLWGAIYRATQDTDGARVFNRLTKLNKKIGSQKFFRFVEKFQPDFILCTHFTPADLLLNHARKFNITKNIGILLTDYAVHALHCASPSEYFFVATPEIKNDLIAIGADPKKISVSGIPIDQVFFEDKPLAPLQTTRNIDPKKPTIIFLSGGEGYAKIDEAIKILFRSNRPFNIMAIAGKNIKLFNQLNSLIAPASVNYIVKGWVENIDEYLRLADIVVTKPGGLTVTECLHLRKPMIIVDPVPGQEEDNLTYLQKNNLGTKLKTPAELPDLVDQILRQPKKINPLPLPNPNQIILEKIVAILS
jgi:processive 1,2-diacylglycerol beta-glucosyltransferase